MFKFGSLVVELSRLTGLIFINTSVDSVKPIERSVRRMLYCHNTHQYQTRDFLYAKILLLVVNLQEIEKYDKDLLDVCKKQLLGSINDNEYFGARFEISSTALLIRKGVQFKKRESPDFLVQAEKAVFLECTSCHISASPDTAGVKASML
jgi:hypothetical protein